MNRPRRANPGDGIFNALDFIRLGGHFGVGSDTHVQVGLADELRQLEYSQRFAHRARNVLGAADCSTERVLLESALKGGAAAVGTHAADIAADSSADLISLNTRHPAMACKQNDALLDAWIFTGGNIVIDCVWVAGKKSST